MKLVYDPHANAAFVEVRKITTGAEKEFVVLDHYVPDTSVVASFSARGALLGLEILGARILLPPEILSGRSDGEFEADLTVRRSVSGEVTSVSFCGDLDGHQLTRVWFDAEADCEAVYALISGEILDGFEIVGDLRGVLDG